MGNVICTGIDRGFGFTKYFSDMVQGGSFDSLVAPISEERAKELISNNKDDENVVVLKRGEDFYLVGNYVAQVEPAYSERDLRRNRNNDNINETILFLAAMGLATGDVEKANIIVTTGLPTDDYDKAKHTYSKTILNNRQPYIFSIIRNGKEYKKEITVVRANIENQPKGTIISIFEDKLSKGVSWSDIKSCRFAICDIGFNTTDLSIYVGKDIVRGEKINFSTFAMVQIASTCKRLIEDHFTCVKSEDEIIEAMKTGMVKIKGKMVDCSELVHKGFLENAEQLINELSSKWEKYLDTFDEMILTGGAVNNPDFAEILKEQISEKCGWEVTVCPDPQFANARGFYIISCNSAAQAEREKAKNNN